MIQRQAIQAIREFSVSCPDTLIAIMQNGGGTWYEMALGIIESLADSPEPGANDLVQSIDSASERQWCSKSVKYMDLCGAK